jgi:hypothetical protein
VVVIRLLGGRQTLLLVMIVDTHCLTTTEREENRTRQDRRNKPEHDELDIFETR